MKLLRFTPCVQRDAPRISAVLALLGLKHDTERRDCLHGHPRPSPAGAPRAAALPDPALPPQPAPKAPRFNPARPARVRQTRTMQVRSPPVLSARTGPSPSPSGQSSGPRRDPRGKGAAGPPSVTRTTRFVPLGSSAPPAPRSLGCSKLAAGQRAGTAGSSRGRGTPGEAGRGGRLGRPLSRPSGGRGGGKPSPGGTERAPVPPRKGTGQVPNLKGNAMGWVCF